MIIEHPTLPARTFINISDICPINDNALFQCVFYVILFRFAYRWLLKSTVGALWSLFLWQSLPLRLFRIQAQWLADSWSRIFSFTFRSVFFIHLFLLHLAKSSDKFKVQWWPFFAANQLKMCKDELSFVQWWIWSIKYLCQWLFFDSFNFVHSVCTCIAKSYSEIRFWNAWMCFTRSLQELKRVSKCVIIVRLCRLGQIW